MALDQLRIEDERSYRHIGLYQDLKQALVQDQVAFRVAPASSSLARWDRVLFLNLTFWSPEEPGDVLETDEIAADVMMHAAWHHITRRALFELHEPSAKSPEGFLLGEAIASAFDMYLVGRLLGHSPDAAFLETQVPAMSEAAESAGMDEDAFEAMLEQVAAEPDRAFEDLRALLFEASTALVRCRSVEDAAQTVERFDKHRFGALLHHYELSTWILYARAYAHDTGVPDARVLEIDQTLKDSKSSLDWLEQNWITKGNRVSKSPSKAKRSGSTR